MLPPVPVLNRSAFKDASMHDQAAVGATTSNGKPLPKAKMGVSIARVIFDF